jgi:predicted ArsR family transcriptional regulator
MAKESAENTNAWYQILEVAKELSGAEKSDFTAAELAARAGIKQTGVATPNQIASAWICKLRDWGYIETNGTAVKGPGRPTNIYRITDKGLACQPEPGFRQRLIDAIRIFQHAYGTGDQDDAFEALIKAANQVEMEFSDKRIKKE